MVKRVVDTAFWTDMQVIEHYSIEDKYFHLYLLTNDKSSQVGIYALPKKVMSFETGFTIDVINILIDRFQNTYKKIQYSEKTQEITILHSLEFSILKGGRPVKDLLERELTRIKDHTLIKATYQNMLPYWNHSKRPFDQTVRELFYKQLQTRERMDQPITRQEPNDPEEKYVERYIEYFKRIHAGNDLPITEKNIASLYYEHLHKALPDHAKKALEQWQKESPLVLVLEAISRSEKAKHPLAYTAKILKNWQEKNIQSINDLKQMEANVTR